MTKLWSVNTRDRGDAGYVHVKDSTGVDVVESDDDGEDQGSRSDVGQSGLVLQATARDVRAGACLTVP